MKPARQMIFGISEGSRGELGGAQIEVGARKFRVLTHSLARTDRLIPNELGSRSALLEEFPLLDDPAVSVDLDRFFFQLPFGIPRPPLHRDGIAAASLENDLITYLGLGQ